MSDYLQNQINYYRVEIAKAKRENKAVDPLNRFTLNTTDYLGELKQEAERQKDILNNTQNTQQLPDNLNTYGIYSVAAHDLFKAGYSEGINRAYADSNGAFEYYFLPIYMIQEAYKPMSQRGEYIGEKGMYRLEFETPDLVYYSDYKGGHHIAIKGTNSFEDLYSDANILLRGNDTDAIMRDVDDAFFKLVKKYPDRKWNIYGHSLGAVRTSILYEQFEDKINKAIVFNMGKSPMGFVGWQQPKNQKKLLHYHIKGDPISNTGLTQDNNVMPLKMLGRPRQGIAEKIKRYHSLDSFLHWKTTVDADKLVLQLGHYKQLLNISSDKKVIAQRYKKRGKAVKELEKRKAGNLRNYRQEEIKRELDNSNVFRLLQRKNRQELEKLASKSQIPNFRNMSTDNLRYLLYTFNAE